MKVEQKMPSQDLYNVTCAHKSILLEFEQHLGEKYIFRRNEDLIQNDEKILEHLKETYGGELILIPGDTNAGKLNETINKFLHDEFIQHILANIILFLK